MFIISFFFNWQIKTQDLFGTSLDKVLTTDPSQNHKEQIDFRVETKKYSGRSLDELIKWGDKFPTSNDCQRIWNAAAAEILVTLCDKQIELIELESESDKDICGDAKSNIEIPDILKSMEYFCQVKKFVSKKGYTEILSTI